MQIDKIKNSVRRWSRNLLLAACCTLCYTACTEELETPESNNTGRAIQIMASMPDDFVKTKAASPKENFKAGDVIHISVEFTLPNESKSSPTVYANMAFDGANWKPKEANGAFNWPWDAQKATFTAYYIPPVGSIKNEDAMSNGEHNTVSMNLSALSEEAVKNGTDPLIATYKDVPVESAVHLQFRHLCTKLTFTNLGSDDDKGFTGLVKDQQELRLSAAGLTDSLIFTREKGKDALTSAFAESKGYLINKVEKGQDGSFSITYLLPPVDVDAGIDLRLAFKDFTPYHLVPIKQKLEAGKHYSLNITELADNYLDAALKEEEWNKGQVTETLSDSEINAYLRAIRDGKEYRKEENGKYIQVLDVYKDGNNSVVTQLCDVDFEGQEFTPVNLGENVIFNGNFHKVKGVKVTKAIDDTKEGKSGSAYMALFGENAGIIKNLILEDVQVNPDPNVTSRYAGILVGWNKKTIENVQIRFAADNAVKSTNSTEYIGALVGMNSGTVSDCTLSGSSFSVEGASTASPFHIGGLVGYNSGRMSNCMVQTAIGSTVKVTSAGAIVYAGGWAGYSINNSGYSSSGCFSSVSLEVEAGTTIYAGGFAGLVGNVVKNCSSTGSVALSGSATNVYAGGFVGNISNAGLNACYATGSLTNTTLATTLYLGGFTGWLTYDGTGTSDLLNCYAIGKPADTGNGFVGYTSSKNNVLDKTKITIRNCFSKNAANAFMGNEDGATLTNYHHNGSDVTVDDLNGSKPEGGFEWTVSPALFGNNCPYLIFKTVE